MEIVLGHIRCMSEAEVDHIERLIAVQSYDAENKDKSARSRPAAVRRKERTAMTRTDPSILAITGGFEPLENQHYASMPLPAAKRRKQKADVAQTSLPRTHGQSIIAEAVRLGRLSEAMITLRTMINDVESTAEQHYEISKKNPILKAKIELSLMQIDRLAASIQKDINKTMNGLLGFRFGLWLWL